MRHFRLVEPKDPSNGNWEPVESIVTDSQVLDEYWRVWWKRAKAFYQKHPNSRLPITKEACIEDWVIINWAEEIR